MRPVSESNFAPGIAPGIRQRSCRRGGPLMETILRSSEGACKSGEANIPVVPVSTIPEAELGTTV